MANETLTLTTAETRDDVITWKASSVTLNVGALQAHIHYQKCCTGEVAAGTAKTTHTMSQADMDAVLSTIVTSDKDSSDPSSAPAGTVS